MLTSQTAAARTAPRLSSKALKLVVASKSPRSQSAKSPRGADAKTIGKKDSIPALAGNFQDRDEIELKISYQGAMPDVNNVEGTRETTPSKTKNNKKKSQSRSSGAKIIAVYSTTKRRKDTDRYEGRDDAESPQLPPGCT